MTLMQRINADKIKIRGYPLNPCHPRSISESYKIIGACFEVYNELGCGYLEAVYQEAPEREFQQQHIPYIKD